nr:ABC transporter substrate-binding protein [Pseudarthrobacter sp. NBSH8]
MANTKVFEAANVPVPDDSTWTWDDFMDTAGKLSAAGDGRSYGAAYGSNEADLIIWLRQHGANLYSQDGKLDFDTATAAAFWERLKEQRDSKASLPASVATEDSGAGLEESLFGTNRVGMAWWWTNQLGSLETTTGSSLRMLRAPSTDGKSADNGMYYKPTMFWSASSRSKHPEAAATFINYLANSPAAGAILMTDRGVPSNSEIVKGITPALKPADTTVVAFLKAIAPDIADAPPVPPVGAGSVQNVIKRFTDEVLYNRMTPQTAAEAFKKEVEGMLATARK